MSLRQRIRSHPKWRRALLAALVVAALFVSAVTIVVWRAPMWAATVAGRGAFRRAGFERASLPTATGLLVCFRAGTGPVVVFLHGVHRVKTRKAERLRPSATGVV